LDEQLVIYSLASTIWFSGVKPVHNTTAKHQTLAKASWETTEDIFSMFPSLKTKQLKQNIEYGKQKLSHLKAACICQYGKKGNDM